MSRQYYGIEDLGMTSGQRQTLIDVLKLTGNNTSSSPNFRNHSRVRLDNLAVIFEGNFNDDEWTVTSITDKLANIFGVNPNNIGTSINQTTYGPVIIFTYNSIDRMRLIAFGGLLATWNESHDLVVQYITNNLVDWEV